MPILQLSLTAAMLLATPEEALQTAIAVQQHQDDSITGWELEFTSECPATRSLIGQNHRPPQRSWFRELRSKDRYRIEQQITTDHGRSGANYHEHLSFNGSTYRSLMEEENSGRTGAKKISSLGYLQYLYGGSGSLVEILRDVETSGRVAWEKLDGRQVLKCDLDLEGGAVRTLYLDPAEQWQPRRIQIDAPIPAGTYADGRVRGITLLEMQAFEHKEGVVLPSKVRLRCIEFFPGGRETLGLENQYTVTKLVINPAIPESEFTIDFPDATRVVDVDRQVSYIEGQPGSEKPRKSRSSGTLATPGPGPIPTPAGSQWFWWADMRTWLAVMAVSLLCIGWAIWRRRQA